MPDYEEKIVFSCVGGFDPNRRDYQMLLDACIALNKEGYRNKYEVRLLGNPYVSQPYADFLNALEKNELTQTIYCDNACTFEHIFATLKKSHFQLFLINPEMEGALEYFDFQITGGMNLSLAFSVIPIVDRKYAERWRFADFSVTHDGNSGFTNAMRQIMSNPMQFKPLRSKMDVTRSKLTEVSLNNLRRKLQSPN